MAESEAIKGIDTLKYMCKYKYECGTCDICYTAVPIAIQALEKQIPKKILKHNICPSCNNSQSTTWYYCGSSYCVFCGQKLDWSE